MHQNENLTSAKNCSDNSTAKNCTTNSNAENCIKVLEGLMLNVFPKLSYAATKLYIFYCISSTKPNFNNQLDLKYFCETNCLSKRTAFYALKELRDKQFISPTINFFNLQTKT